MKKVLLSFSTIVCLALAGCGGGDGGASVGGYSHTQLAQMFVQNIDASGQMNVTLVKSNTEQYNWIVVQDKATNRYIAVDLTNYQPNSDAYSYFQNNQSRFYYNLTVLAGHYESENQPIYQSTSDNNGYGCGCYIDNYVNVWVETRYQDAHTGVTFEKVNASPKDLEKMAALKEAVAMNQTVQNLQSNFGLSAERSEQVARLTSAWKKAGGKDLTATEHDNFAKEVLGFSITEAKAAWGSNNKASIDQLIDKAAQTNGTTPENVRQIINGFVNN